MGWTEQAGRKKGGGLCGAAECAAATMASTRKYFESSEAWLMIRICAVVAYGEQGTEAACTAGTSLRQDRRRV
eukprot:2856685-Rhodomonas_salina.1